MSIKLEFSLCHSMFVETPRVSFTGGSQTLPNDTEFHAEGRRFSGSVSHYQTDKRSVHQKNDWSHFVMKVMKVMYMSSLQHRRSRIGTTVCSDLFEGVSQDIVTR